MKILHVAQPAEAGVPRAVASLVEDGSDGGYDFVVASSSHGELARVCADRGLAFESWDAVRSPVRGVRRELTALRDIVDRVRPDVVVLHSAKAGLIGRLLLRGRIPTVYAPHAWSFLAAEGVVRALAVQWERVAQAWTAVTVCMCCDEAARGRRARIWARYRVVRNGVDFHCYPAEATPLTFPNRTVVCVGRLCRQKGQDVLLEAWKGVQNEVPDAELVLVGDGPDREELQARADSSVKFVGNVLDPRSFYGSARVVVVPSRWETMSLVALEGMASQRPVVACDFDGARECLAGTGIIVPIEDVGALSRALADVLREDAEMWERAACAAREEALAAGDIRATRQGWRAVYVEATLS